VTDFETKLRWLSQRGNLVGPDELIERMEAELAGDPLVAVTKRRKGGLMTSLRPAPTTERRNRPRSQGLTWGVAVFALILAIGGIAILVSSLQPDPGPVAPPQSPLQGTWVTMEADGSTHVATFTVSADGVVELVANDDFATVCSGAPSTIVGTGRLDTNTVVFPSPVLTCDDGSQPQTTGGTPLEEQLRDLTFTYDPQSDTLTDTLGSVWTRRFAEGPDLPEDPNPDVSILWPQTSLEDVKEAQRRANAGDPDYAWQVDPDLGWQNSLEEDRRVFESSEILTRFIREELGWEAFRLWWGGHGDLGLHGPTDNTFIRCAPGETNSLYPNDVWGGDCAPTIDDFHYEWVSIDVARLNSTTLDFDFEGAHDPDGVWVVSGWRMLPPLEQWRLSDVEISGLLEDFLEARLSGEGAESYVLVPVEIADMGYTWQPAGSGDVPLMYATTTGAGYERYEYEVVGGPRWPNSEMELEVRLFAQGGETVVEQKFYVGSDSRLGLEFCLEPPKLCDGAQTTENGRPIP
jgi:hypothetical protein